MNQIKLSLLIATCLIIGALAGPLIWSADDQDQQRDSDVRIAARRLADGTVEVALQQRHDDRWGERQLPGARFLPPTAPNDVWLRSSAISIETPPEACSPNPLPRTLRYVYFDDFAPVSYTIRHPNSGEGADRHSGYEADLIRAIESMTHTNLRFIGLPTSEWPNVWLTPAHGEVALAAGGITILDARTRDADGRTVVVFTDGHISFRQSLLIRAEDADHIKTHDDLTSSHFVGAIDATTGESRLLQLIGAAAADGRLLAGTRVETSQGDWIASASQPLRITPAESTARLSDRVRLIPPGDRPQVVYLGDDEAAYLAALRAGQIDAFARGQIGNTNAAISSDSELLVTALDSALEIGGFTLRADDLTLRNCLNRRINWLTHDRQIGYADWAVNPNVFIARAQLWNNRYSD